MIFVISCEKDPEIIKDDNGVIISQPWLWRTNLTESSLIGAIVSGPAWYDGQVLMGAMDENNIAYLACLDIQNGKIIWKQDYIKQYDFFSFQDFYKYDNIIVQRDGTNLFCIDLKNGEYLWKQKMEGNAWRWPSGLDSLFFVFSVEPYPEYGYPVMSANFGSIKDGNTHLFLIPDLGDLPVPDLSREDFIGGFRYIKPFYDENTHKILLLCYYEKFYYLVNSETQVSQSYVGLYNFSKREWIYERKELGDHNFLEGLTPQVIGDRFYHTLGNGLAECRNLYTGELVWRKKWEGGFFSPIGFIIVDNKMIVMENNGRQLIAIDIVNGNILWHETSAPTISPMVTLNGVVYYASSADGRIHAVDIETGKHLWRLISPDAKNNESDFFMRQCMAVPDKNGGKGKIIVSSYSHGYCYEAAN
ncbi:MAG TPA: PQQ-binding-like beta-propeller repeat protein [Bacteroidales bacterium]|nr:PQQ-binding-like beta-propeller repeat protein [Bacteroidales bacterium]